MKFGGIRSGMWERLLYRKIRNCCLKEGSLWASRLDRFFDVRGKFFRKNSKYNDTDKAIRKC